MTEEQRIESIRMNGGRHLQNFKPENITYAMCLVAVTLDGFALHFVPNQYLNEEIYTAACSSCGAMLYHVPKEYINNNICECAVKDCGTALKYVPIELRSENICFYAVCRDQKSFQFVPRELITPEFCAKIAKEKNADWISSLPESYKTTSFYVSLVDIAPECLYNIPKKNRTTKVCKTAINRMGFNTLAAATKHDPVLFCLAHPSLYDHDSCLEFVKTEYFQNHIKNGSSYWHNREVEQISIDEYTIPIDKVLKYYDVCQIAVLHNRSMLNLVPLENITYELCLSAVEENGEAYQFVPAKYRTNELSQIAFNKDHWSIKYIPPEFITGDMAKAAISDSGYLLEFIPENLRTEDICLLAVSDVDTALSHVPQNILSKQIILATIENASNYDRSILQRIPSEYIDYDICLADVKRNGDNLQYVPEHLKNQELCRLAVQTSSRCAQYIPHDFFDPDICLAIVKDNDYSFKYIPQDKLTYETCMTAIRHGRDFYGTILKSVPAHLITQEMCDLAIAISVHSLSAVPEKFVTEEMLLHVATVAPGRLSDNFPIHFQSKEFIEKLLRANPRADTYIAQILESSRTIE